MFNTLLKSIDVVWVKNRFTFDNFKCIFVTEHEMIRCLIPLVFDWHQIINLFKIHIHAKIFNQNTATLFRLAVKLMYPN